MCGILGRVGRESAIDTDVSRLASLEYRGFDSAGVAIGGNDVDVCKREGELEALRTAIGKGDTQLSGDVDIGHTRWS